MAKRKIGKITELRDLLCDTFLDLKDGITDHKVAKEMNNSAGKIIGITALKLKACEVNGEKSNDAFLN
jgi:hypothetical protein